jgi:hypothetical protein
VPELSEQYPLRLYSQLCIASSRAPVLPFEAQTPVYLVLSLSKTGFTRTELAN